ncbi:MAG: hypothetical protein QGG40_11080 [Myxococcota bacterium]|nr:hypothetical protein [Myxococcota bacterium]
MLRTFALSTIAFGLVGCSDYDLKMVEDDPAAPLDTAVEEDSAEPVDTGEPPEPEDPDAPIAVCEVSPNPVAPPFESAAWVGVDSYDPNDEAITDYEWTLLTIPSGSTATMPSGGANRTGFVPDLAGDYVGQLVVTNESGVQSDPCEATLESIPAEDLWVEMYWETDGDDMDLHLLAPGGSIESNSDCYFMNCVDYGWGTLDWGTSGDSTDDPTLDLDDITGTGPENINIESPEEDVYTVVVHDYPGSSYTPDNDVTINVYLNGSMVWTDTRAISGEDTYTVFAEIDWGAGTVTSM